MVAVEDAFDVAFAAELSLREKQIQQVDKILTKLGKKWDKILAGQGK
mgnify:CR=1 FL=1